MKKLFVTGLIMILPFTITILIVIFLVNLLTKPFVGIFENLLLHYNVLGADSPLLLEYLSKLLILMALFGLTLFLGLIGKWFMEHYLIGLSNLVFHRIPLINKIYKACQEMVNTLFTSKSNSFQKVVLAPFPSKHSLSVGLISRQELAEGSSEEIKSYSTVLVPGTPNPTMGFVLLYKQKDLVHTDMKPEDALKCVVSCGIILKDFSTLEAHE